ncbi:ATP-binding protein [uncultured Aquabacterium sp.]|jgi:signal transduction histidine kinase/ActR/RegA family two-component response regulator|nr:ATP-binding protein [uncultured Aquabacterium sp.]
MRSLRLFLPVALAILLLAIGTVSVSLSLKQRQDRLTDTVQREALGDVSRLVRLSDEGMGTASALVAAEIAQIASRPYVRMVLLISEHGEVLRAHRTDWRGRHVNQVAPQLDPARIARVATSRLPDWHMTADRGTLDALQSFERPSGPDEVRSLKRGLAYVAYDLKQERADAARNEVLARLPDLIGLIVVFVLVGWWLGRNVTRPLARLDAAASALRAGELSAPVPRGGFKEIDQLGAGLDALREELSATWQAIPDLLFELDAHGRYRRVLAMRPELVVQAPPDLVGRTIHEVLSAESAAVVQQALEDAARSGCVWGREVAINVPAGQRWFDISVARKTRLDDGTLTFLVISRDITERKQGEMALSRVNEQLEHRVQERTAELLTAKNEAERADRSKSEFLSRMSHELRTPLNAIIGFGQLLDMTVPDSGQRRQVGHIISAGHHLLTLINEILDLSRVEAGQMNVSLERVRVDELVAECVDLMRPLAEGHDVKVEVETIAPSIEVRADRTRLRQVLLNLLSNGVKYNRRGGQLTLTLVQRPTLIELRVQDTGAGLTQAQQERLFTPFERLDADARQIDGTGIGLALSRRLMHLMGGEIGVHSQPGQGSTFWITLARWTGKTGASSASEPVSATSSRETPSAGPAASGSSWTVLCIEDNAVNLQFIEHAFARWPDLQLLTADTPRAGLALAAERQPDLVLLDINLPDMDGYEVLRRLKSEPVTADIPVVALTANAMVGDAATARRAGFDGYITKPIHLGLLRTEIDRWRTQAATKTVGQTAVQPDPNTPEAAS